MADGPGDDAFRGHGFGLPVELFLRSETRRRMGPPIMIEVHADGEPMLIEPGDGGSALDWEPPTNRAGTSL